MPREPMTFFPPTPLVFARFSKRKYKRFEVTNTNLGVNIVVFFFLSLLLLLSFAFSGFLAAGMILASLSTYFCGRFCRGFDRTDISLRFVSMNQSGFFCYETLTDYYSRHYSTEI